MGLAVNDRPVDGPRVVGPKVDGPRVVVPKADDPRVGDPRVAGLTEEVPVGTMLRAATAAGAPAPRGAGPTVRAVRGRNVPPLGVPPEIARTPGVLRAVMVRRPVVLGLRSAATAIVPRATGRSAAATVPATATGRSGAAISAGPISAAAVRPAVRTATSPSAASRREPTGVRVPAVILATRVASGKTAIRWVSAPSVLARSSLTCLMRSSRASSTRSHGPSSRP